MNAPEIAAKEAESRHPVFLHWAPKAVETDPFTACGMNIDTPNALAWTRSTDLEAYHGRPMEGWPPPCPVCLEAATAREAAS